MSQTTQWLGRSADYWLAPVRMLEEILRGTVRVFSWLLGLAALYALYYILVAGYAIWGWWCAIVRGFVGPVTSANVFAISLFALVLTVGFFRIWGKIDLILERHGR